MSYIQVIMGLRVAQFDSSRVGCIWTMIGFRVAQFDIHRLAIGEWGAFG